jgi:hypothetical protein
MRSLWLARLALGCSWLTSMGAQAQETEPSPPGPDLDFLEYLGAWAEEDDEWLAIEEWQKDPAEEPDEDPDGAEKEKDDDDESE